MLTILGSLSVLEQVSLGTIASIVTSIGAIVLCVWKWFDRSYKARKNIEQLIEQIKKHDTEISKVSKEIKEIKEILIKQNENTKQTTVASFRATIWRIYTDSIAQGYITREGLTTFEEAVEIYEQNGGNDIVHEKLYPEVMALEIR